VCNRHAIASAPAARLNSSVRCAWFDLMKWVAFLVIVALASLASAKSGKDDCKGVPSASSPPRTLNQALDTLLAKLPPETIADIQQSSEADMVEYHFTLGLSIRNCWGLWSGGPLYSHFHKLGLFHPDDMSAIILTSLWRRIHGQPLEIAGQIKEYQEYWRVSRDPDPKSNSHCPSGIITTLSGTPAATTPEMRGVHIGKCCKDGKVWAYHVDKGWYPADLQLLAIWNQGHGYDTCKSK
jgi:hypothetical protein